MIAILLYFLYTIMITAYLVGWFRLSSKSFAPATNTPKVSVLVPIRNEAQALPALLAAIRAQTYSSYQVLFIDDHSQDSSQQIVESCRDLHFRWLTSPQTGKKAAIAYGVSQATGDLVLTTDADALPVPTWIETMANAYTQGGNELLIGPVIMSQGNPMQILEYLSVLGSTAGSAGVHHAVMCSGANLAFSPEWYEKCKPYLHPELASGDDMFLLEATKRLSGGVRYVKQREAQVKITGCTSLWKFIQQRARWTTKSLHYSDWDIRLVGALVLLVQLILLPIYVIGWTTPILFAFFGWKLVVDSILLISVAIFTKQTKVLWYILPLSILYPFYILFVAVYSLFPQTWKGRKV